MFETKNHQFKPIFKDVFQKAGAIREAQIHIRVASQYNVSLVRLYTRGQLKIQEAYISKLSNAINSFDYKELDHLREELNE
ncbi:MAG: hypothetical protein AAF363_18030 [Bacteroidota bacterium]